jgi:predicted ATPase/DNA-binding winged helix-turn-helix (wHTH) protein
MTEEGNRRSEAVVSFGRYRLFIARRILERAGTPLHLGARALDVLIILVESAGKVVSKGELLSRVWPDTAVDEGALRFQIVALRKALGDGEAGARYVTTLSGRGYCFVAPISHSGLSTPADTEDQAHEQPHRLPTRLARMVGRGDAVHDIASRLIAERFVTVAGPGGIGKTTVAVSVGYQLLDEFAGGIRFVDLGPINDPLLVSGAVTLTLGLPVRSSDPTGGLISFLRDRRMLLILDSCEHVIETAAALAERIFAAAPQVHVLATSRESLRVEGEHVYRLLPLGSPPDEVELSAAQALGFSAVQLFVERANASGRRFVLNDAEAPVVGEICRRLDGIALAIELAASRSNACTIPETLELLNNRFRLLREGRRTALPRHQTLTATLDWSYDLLSEDERLTLRRLSVFVGAFTLNAASEVAAGEGLDGQQVVRTLSGLVEKSLVAVSVGDETTRYRLLDTTRAYVIDKLAESGEADAINRRHADYYRELLVRTDSIHPAGSEVKDEASHAQHLDNVRAGLKWSFSGRGDVGIGIALAAASSRLFLEMSLLTECHRWSETALAALDESDRGTRREMELQAALGQSLMFTKGNSDAARISLSRGLQLAEELGDLRSQLRLLGRLSIFDQRTGNCHSAFALARRSEIVATSIGDPASIVEANWSVGFSNYFAGNQRSAESKWAPSLIQPNVPGVSVDRDTLARMRCGLTAVRWLRGFPDQAVKIAKDTIDEGTNFKDPSTLCICLIFIGFAFLRIGNWTEAAKVMERILSHARKYSLGPYEAIGIAMRGMLAINRGEAEAGVELLRGAVETLHAGRYELHSPVFLGALAEGLGMMGECNEALATIDEAIARVGLNGQLFSLPEFMRIKGEILISAAQPEFSEAESLFRRALDLAGQQLALSWELRAAKSLARLWYGQGRAGEALSVLAPVYARFTEGFESADLTAARRLLDGLRERTSTDNSSEGPA